MGIFLRKALFTSQQFSLCRQEWRRHRAASGSLCRTSGRSSCRLPHWLVPPTVRGSSRRNESTRQPSWHFISEIKKTYWIASLPADSLNCWNLITKMNFNNFHFRFVEIKQFKLGCLDNTTKWRLRIHLWAWLKNVNFYSFFHSWDGSSVTRLWKNEHNLVFCEENLPLFWIIILVQGLNSEFLRRNINSINTRGCLEPFFPSKIHFSKATVAW